MMCSRLTTYFILFNQFHYAWRGWLSYYKQRKLICTLNVLNIDIPPSYVRLKHVIREDERRFCVRVDQLKDYFRARRLRQWPPLPAPPPPAPAAPLPPTRRNGSGRMCCRHRLLGINTLSCRPRCASSACTV